MVMLCIHSIHSVYETGSAVYTQLFWQKAAGRKEVWHRQAVKVQVLFKAIKACCDLHYRCLCVPCLHAFVSVP